MTAPFVHLRLHTEYSLVDGLIRIKKLVKEVALADMPAVAVTDMSNLFALIKFYKAALGAGVKPIVGVEAWVGRNNESFRLVLLCQNLSGYRNLTRLVSRSFLEGQQRGVPVIDYAWLDGNTEGLIALSGGRDGELGQALLNDRGEQAKRDLAGWRRLFPDRFYLEVQRTGRPQEAEYLEAALDLAAATGTPLVATNDVCFLQRDDFEAHEARVCVYEGATVDDPRRPRRYSEQQYLRTPAEMAELFADLPEALENSVEIARRCNLRLELGKNVLPDFPVPAGLTAEAYFSTQARAGLEQRLRRLLDPAAPDFAERRQPYDERLAEELGVIIQMGFPGYFLIVADFIRWARENGVPVGPGRGSGAGSLVAYALGITDLDPLAYDLLFERFLNPERVSMPDFDIDFCMEGRDRVIDYVAQRYGRDRVSQIATHGTMAAKAVVRDVGRVLGHPYGFVDRIAKLIPFEIGMTLDKAIEREAELRRLYETDQEVRALLELARKLEGLARNVGKHAGGVVIAPSELTDFSPLYREQGDDSSLITQFDKDDVEAAGLVKFDFLGLRTLTIIDWAVQTLNEQRRAASEPPLDITGIPLVDREAFDLLKRHQTTAVFQLESSGMKDLIRRLQPDCFEDIVALVALFRPGPLQSGMVDDFIDRKHGRARIEYPHSALATILKPTYGVILYQEQVMQIAQVLAGYTLGGADLLRRAMGKKKPEEMAKQREIFVKGSVERAVEPETASYIFDLMEKFAGYGFNKSHSAAYALVSYQTAWLKAHHPAAFMAAVLSSDMDKTDKVVVFIEECRRMGLKLAPPDINQSEYRFTVGERGEIRYGLGAIKGAGEAVIEHLVAERRRAGPYRDLFDLCQRADLHKLNRRVLDALIRSGAFDALGPNRATLDKHLPAALQLAEQHSRNDSAGQNDLFGLAAAEKTPAQPSAVTDVAEWDEEQRLHGEKETLGVYLTGHPIHRVAEELAALNTTPLRTVMENGGSRRNGNRQVLIAGLVVSVRTRNANRGGRIAFVVLDDASGRLEIRVFPEAYERYRALIVEDAILVVQGALGWDEFNQTTRLNVEGVLSLESARAEYARRLVLKIDGERLESETLRQLAQLLTEYRSEGRCAVWVDYLGSGARAELAFGSTWRVRPDAGLLDRLRELPGVEAVRLGYEAQPSMERNSLA
ncbi:MAG: DNA polymerase III subunit alpha [Candidatus Competibacteraceae bacterium]|nr:DNA polymerase III subunit alpha [Candidatus Competibacteraceae bacterium]